MISNNNDILNIVKSNNLTYQQKLFLIANTAERLFDPRELLNYTDFEYKYLENDMICDLNEGYAIYRPRYIVPDYSVLLENGCDFLSLEKPTNLDDVLDSLLILYHNVPSITSFPVFIGHLDKLIDPFITNVDEDYIKIKRFLNHIDKTIPDSFCHGNIGPEKTTAGVLIIKAVIELENPTPNITLKYNDNTDDEFMKQAIEACLKVSKPSFCNDDLYKSELGEYAIASCYNALPLAGGAYTLPRLRLGTIAKAANSLDELIDTILPDVSRAMCTMIDKRIKFLVEESNFFSSSFLVKEGFIKQENFSAMFGIVGLADAVNYILELEGINERFGKSPKGDEIGHKILNKINTVVDSHTGVYSNRTNNKYLLHAQVGAKLSDEDFNNTPAHRVSVGDEPILPMHMKQAAPFHKYFISGTGDYFAFDQTYLNKLDSVLDIIKGSFKEGFRYITTYLQNSDLIRVTGYLVKKSEVEKYDRGEVVLRDTTSMGHGTNTTSKVFERRTRSNDE